MTAKYTSIRSMRITDHPLTTDQGSIFKREDEDEDLIFDDSYWLDTEKINKENACTVSLSWSTNVQASLCKSTGVYSVVYSMTNTKDDCHEYCTTFEISAPGEVALLENIVSGAGLFSMAILWELIDTFYYILDARGPETWAMDNFIKYCYN